jgi:hypothetical protein
MKTITLQVSDDIYEKYPNLKDKLYRIINILNVPTYTSIEIIGFVEDVVCKEFAIKPESLYDGTRTYQVVTAKYTILHIVINNNIGVFISKKELTNHYKISREMLYHALKTIDNKISVDKNFKLTLARIIKKVFESI